MRSTLDNADVVVIGGGVVGLATAYFTARRGVDVVLLEKGIPGWEASGRNGGWADTWAESVSAARLLKAGNEIWRTLDEELGASTEFVNGGYLSPHLTEGDIKFEQRLATAATEAGMEARRVDWHEANEIVPGLAEEVLGGVFYPTSGQANPQLTSQAWAWANRRIGTRIHQDTEVIGIDVEGGRVKAVETTRGKVSTEMVVNAAGPWSAVVNGMVNLELPTMPNLIQILCTQPLPPFTRSVWSGNELYCRQAAAGHLHFGSGPSRDIEIRQDSEKPTNAVVTASTARKFMELMPGMGSVPVLRTWAGIIDATPDHLPIVDQIEGLDGYYVNIGFGGIGFAWSPIAGTVMSEILTDGNSRFDVEFLRASRFDGDEVE